MPLKRFRITASATEPDRESR